MRVPRTARSVGSQRRFGSRALRTVCSAGLCLALVTSATLALAQEDAAIAMARERFKEGVQYFDQKQYDKARAAFLQAYALKRHPAVLLNLAQSELRSGHEADAAKHFSQYLREHKDATDAERQAAEAGLVAAKAVVTEVTVNVDEEGAAISVDGVSEGTSPLASPLYLTPGARTIVARKEGRESTVQINTAAGQSTAVNLRLGRRPVATSAASRKPPEPRASTTEDTATSPPPSEATVEDPSSDEDGARPPFFRWFRETPLAWVGGGLAVAGLGGGIGFALASRHSYSNADSVAEQIRNRARELNLQPEGICSRAEKETTLAQANFPRACNVYSDEVDKGDRYKTLSWVSAGVGAVALTGTVVYYFVSTPKSGSSAARRSSLAASVHPWVGADAQGLSIVGSF